MVQKSEDRVNENGGAYAAWAWDAGSSNTTIAAGGLNSSLYDQSQTWSSGTFFNANGNAFYNSGGSAAQLFDNVESAPGSTGDFALPVDGGTFTLTFSQFSSAQTVELEVEGTGNALKINGSFVTIPSGSPATATYSVSGLTTIEWLYNGGSNYCYLGSIKVDGAKLIDSGVSVTNVPSIASTVRANPSAGFSIVSATAPSSNTSFSLGHGLNAAPSFIIFRQRAASNWAVYHSALASAETKYLHLNSSNAEGTAAVWNNTAPTSSVFESTMSGNWDLGADMIAYCFAPVEGYSAMGSYLGNGSADGPFVFTGFRPRWLLIKRSDAAGNWIVIDTARSTYNATTTQLLPHLTDGDYVNANEALDIVSNGFKPRSANSGHHNISGATYIYYAVAEHPFKNSRAR